MELLIQHRKADLERFNVLNHRDLWINNLMFSDTDVIFLDYQICQWASPVLDILYFLITSCTAQIIVEGMDNLLDYYYGELNQAMLILNCKTKAPTITELKEELRTKGVLAVIFVSQDLALIKADPSLNVEINTFTDETLEAEETRKKIYSIKEYTEDLQLLLPFFEAKGLLDVEI